MWILRAPQLAAMERERKEAAVRAAVRYVRREVGAGPEVAPRVRDAMARARELGWTGPWDACRFALFSIALGEHFHEELDWARRALADESKTSSERMDAVEIVYRNYYARDRKRP